MTMLRTIFFTILAVSCVTLPLKSMQEDLPAFQTIHDFPNYYVDLMVQSRAGLVEYRVNDLGMCVKLKTVIVDKHDYKIVGVLNTHHRKVCSDKGLIPAFQVALGEKYLLHVNFFELSDVELKCCKAVLKRELFDEPYLKEGRDRQSTLREIVLDRYLSGKIDKICSLPELKDIYKAIVQVLRTNWHRYISTYEIDGESLVFAKNKNLLIEEAILINYLLQKFDLEKSVKCFDQLGLTCVNTCIIVKKDAWEGFQGIFDLEVQ